MQAEFTYKNHDFMVESDSCRYVDNGIGRYEYCGARGVHTDIQFEAEDFELYLVHNGRYRELTDFSDELCDKAIDALEEQYKLECE